ncbi:conserved hypothetical protein [Xanthomonas citri pv. fuscans]|nr:conserved hypothetical protein [Xanthomonas citri pv. fuscans]
MRGGIAATADSGRAAGYRLAWPAYVWPFVQLVGLCAVSWLIVQLSWAVGAALLMLGLFRFIYQILWAASYELYTDIAGVWVYRGVFPWNRGSYGVRWSDAEDAVYHTGLFAWVTRSFRVRVRNRFSPRAEIDLAHVHLGDEAVTHINQRQAKERQLDLAVVVHELANRSDRG